MNPTVRDFLNFAVIAAPLPQFIAECQAGPPDRFAPQETTFRLPLQPYSEISSAPPMLLWAPRCSTGLTAFMPHVQSGGYFVVDAAYQVHRHKVAQARISSATEEYPVNEFVS